MKLCNQCYLPSWLLFKRFDNRSWRGGVSIKNCEMSCLRKRSWAAIKWKANWKIFQHITCIAQFCMMPIGLNKNLLLVNKSEFGVSVSHFNWWNKISDYVSVSQLNYSWVVCYWCHNNKKSVNSYSWVVLFELPA